jgi:hypothetical protein
VNFHLSPRKGKNGGESADGEKCEGKRAATTPIHPRTWSPALFPIDLAHPFEPSLAFLNEISHNVKPFIKLFTQLLLANQLCPGI